MCLYVVLICIAIGTMRKSSLKSKTSGDGKEIVLVKHICGFNQCHLFILFYLQSYKIAQCSYYMYQSCVVLRTYRYLYD